ncbi:MAG: DHA2 family efflux MFS transporter permease subunit [Desulfobacterales bacterium]
MQNSERDEGHRWVVLGIIMMGTFMAILDASIVNVALPHMMSAFGVNRNQIEWVTTGFMLATAVAMPVVGWIVLRSGHKSLYIVSLGLFTLGSAACAFSWSYQVLLVSRIVQAVGGGAIQPVGMTIIAELFEPHERGKALGIWGTGIMIGPTLGPTLGGYLTDWFSWRTIFSVNLPIGVVTLIAALLVMDRDDPSRRKNVNFDWFGFLFLSAALISGLLALSQGQEKGWSSNYVMTCLIIATVGTVLFLGIESSIQDPLLDLSLFTHRNYSLSMVLALFRAVGLFGGIFLLPIFLENLVGYTTIRTGLLMMPGAVTIGIMMPISGKMADRYSARWLVTIGTIVTGFSFFLYANLDPLSGMTVIIGPQIIRGVGMALMMAPLMRTAINSVPRHQVATASSFLNVAQRLGGSFGIAILNTFVTDSVRKHAIRIAEHAAPQSSHFVATVHQIATFPHYLNNNLSAAAQGQLLYVKTILHKANVLGFDNGFFLGGIIVLSSIPLCLMLKSR